MTNGFTDQDRNKPPLHRAEVEQWEVVLRERMREKAARALSTNCATPNIVSNRSGQLQEDP